MYRQLTCPLGCEITSGTDQSSRLPEDGFCLTFIKERYYVKERNDRKN